MRIPMIAAMAAGLSVSAFTSASADPVCGCRTSEGERVDLGQVVCLHLSGRDQLARCEMVLNNTSWKKLRDGCPLSAVDVWTDDRRS